ncbi:60S ribosomal protein L27 [Trifolium repens]|nr:60S ribosomal protein L27 [Trifolium repens]
MSCTFSSILKECDLTRKSNVYPQEVQPTNPDSYRARKIEYFQVRPERKKSAQERRDFQPQLMTASSEDDAVTNPDC